MGTDLIEKHHRLTMLQLELEALDREKQQLEDRQKGEHVGMAEALDIYTMLRKLDSVKLLSNGGAGLYITPNDVNLSVGQLYPADNQQQGKPVRKAPGQQR